MILAAGRGTRLGFITDEIPKPLLSFMGVTLISRVILTLQHSGISRMNVGVGWKRELIRKHLSSNKFHSEINVVDVPNYSIGPLQTFVTTTYHLSEQSIFICPADYIFTQNVSSILIRSHTQQSSESVLTLGVSETGSSSTIFGDEDGNLLGVRSPICPAQPIGHSAMAMVANPKFLQLAHECLRKGMTTIGQVINYALKKNHPIRYTIVPKTWVEIDTINDILPATKSIMEWSLFYKNTGLFVPQNDVFEIGTPLHLPNSIILGAGVTIRGPTFIANNSLIGGPSEIGPNVLLEPNSSITSGTTIRNAYLGNGSSIYESSNLENVVVFGGKIVKIGV